MSQGVALGSAVKALRADIQVSKLRPLDHDAETSGVLPEAVIP